MRRSYSAVTPSRLTGEEAGLTDTVEAGAVTPAATAGHVESPWRSVTPAQRHTRRRLLIGVTVLFVAVAAVFGFPTGREVITGWVLLFLFAACAGRIRLWSRVVVHDWVPLIAVLFLYDFLRGSAKRVGASLADLPTLHADQLNPAVTAQAHVSEPIDVDKALFGGHVPTVWLQQHFYTPGVVHWWDALAVPVYFSHFIVSLAVAVALWAVSYRLYRRYVWTLVILTLITLATYAAFPAAPPWMAGLSGNDVLPHVSRVVSDTLKAMGGHTVNSAVERGDAYSNRVAAMPSLHGAIPMMLTLFAWPLVRWWARIGLLAYALAMAVTLVYGGEHYVTDVLVGWLYALVVVVAVRHWFDGRENADSPRP
jgi:membrane-associated phospholipid phosphatase